MQDIELVASVVDLTYFLLTVGLDGDNRLRCIRSNAFDAILRTIDNIRTYVILCMFDAPRQYRDVFLVLLNSQSFWLSCVQVTSLLRQNITFDTRGRSKNSKSYVENCRLLLLACVLSSKCSLINIRLSYEFNVEEISTEL